jgi:hypothetical protein
LARCERRRADVLYNRFEVNVIKQLEDISFNPGEEKYLVDEDQAFSNSMPARIRLHGVFSESYVMY